MDWPAFQLEAHCKINLYLRVLGRREDGYHELDTLFQELSWGDRVLFQPSEKFEFVKTGLEYDSGRQDICISAYKTFCRKFGRELPVTISLKKHVPPGSGLGGGSADAAAVLKGLNEIADPGLPAEILDKLALELGADVPFFLRGGLQRGLGVGEEMTALEAEFEGFILLVIPPIHVSTKQAFEALKLPLTAQGSPITFGRLVDKTSMVRFFENDFESVVFHMHPEIGAIKHQLLEAGAYYASLSGSGSTVYGIFDTLDTALAAETRFVNRYHTQITTPTY